MNRTKTILVYGDIVQFDKEVHKVTEEVGRRGASVQAIQTHVLLDGGDFVFVAVIVW